jgi:hypothetical protein
MRFVAPQATDEEITAALHQSAAHTLLARASAGLDTLIGEGGVKVSGGEKQRLSIARALLRHPALLVFDEATSALDSLTEEEISRTVRELSASGQHLTILTASAPSSTPTASSSSNAARSLSPAATPNSSKPKGCITPCGASRWGRSARAGRWWRRNSVAHSQ